jgi:phenylpropionate dioxygenase-like ring-hydroxylating dioxygenase large terminal subunit
MAMLDTATKRKLASYVDVEKGLVARNIFSDADIYQMEMEQIFARAWLFMCHESQIPNPGDFFLNFMGEDRVIIVRNNEGGISVLVNSCRHRGNAVCRADEGHATSFMCTYHGWTYDLNGALVGVPGFKEVYHEELDRENWGLIRAPQVDSYKGFVFATMDPEAVSLNEFLGSTGRTGIDLVADQGEMECVGGVQKWTMNVNWKFPTDNTADFYHGMTHTSAHMVTADSPNWKGRNAAQGRRRRVADNGQQRRGVAMLGEYGHVGGLSFLPDTWETDLKDDPTSEWRYDPEVKVRMGDFKFRASGCMTNLFPNIFIPAVARQVAIRMPKGPMKSEIWYFTFIDKNASPEMRERHKYLSVHQFAASGLWEQDDGENWEQSTRGSIGTIARRYPINYQMGLNRGEIINDETGPPRVEAFVTENYMLWQHRAWSEWMQADSWDELKRNHSKPEGTV